MKISFGTFLVAFLVMVSFENLATNEETGENVTAWTIQHPNSTTSGNQIIHP
jgi:hypothetical protein